MKRVIDYNLTIDNFLNSAVAFLNGMPYGGTVAQRQKEITQARMNHVVSDPRKYTTCQEIYPNMHEFQGFVEHEVKYTPRGASYLITNNEVYFAIIHMLDAIGKFYEKDYAYTEGQLLKSLKEYNVALNRKNVAKKMINKFLPETYFASHVASKQK